VAAVFPARAARRSVNDPLNDPLSIRFRSASFEDGVSSAEGRQSSDHGLGLS
jgi:hypothetical protein